MSHEMSGSERERWGRVRMRPGAGGRKGWGVGNEEGERVTGHRIRTGKPQVRPAKPSHVAGVREGNAPGSYKAQPGHNEDGTSTARRSTGINAKYRNPIDPSAPNLSPP